MEYQKLTGIMATFEEHDDRDEIAISEDLSHISVQADEEIGSAEIIGKLANIFLSNPEIQKSTGQFFIKEGGTKRRLLNITSDGVSSFDDELLEDVGEYSDISAYDHTVNLKGGKNSPETLSEHIQSLCEELEDEAKLGYSIDLSVSKDSIVNIAARDSLLDYDIEFKFWYNLESLKSWIADHGIASQMNLFSHKQSTVLLYQKQPDVTIEQNLTISDVDPKQASALFPILSLTDLDRLQLSQEAITDYIEDVSRTSNITSTQDVPLLTPSIFLDQGIRQDLFREMLIYNIFGVFSDRVEQTSTEDQFTFEINTGTHHSNATIDFGSEDSVSEKDLDELVDLYDRFERIEEIDTFVSMWRRSIAEECPGKNGLLNLPQKSKSVIKKFEFLKKETLDSKLQELSTAIRDTQNLMTNVTNQISNTTANISKEIQRLTIALLTAFVANLFVLIQDIQSITLALSFSIAITGGFILFYVPIIDERVVELDELQLQAEQDYETYRQTIGSYSNGPIDIEHLNSRKNKYIDQVRDSIEGAYQKIFFIHTTLLITSVLLFSISFISYDYPSMPVILSILLFVGIGYQTLRMFVEKYNMVSGHSFYRLSLWRSVNRDQRYCDDNINLVRQGFPNHFLTLCFVILIILLILNFFGTLPDPPMFETTEPIVNSTFNSIMK